jgi:NAD(P)-dependent dehydrogenase (short-subunit alcohol dehydrogenase family)
MTAMTMTDAESGRASPVAAGKLAGRAVLITGGTRGIGAAICASLAGQGASVAAGYSGDTDRAKAFVGDFARQFGPARITVHRGNVASPADCQRVVQEVIAEHGRLDILVNNAGVTVDKLAVDLTTADWDKVLTVNLSGAFHMAQAALAHMLERGTGRIINVSSLAGEIGNIGQANYAASKSGLLGLTKALAREAAFLLSRSGPLTPDTIGITVNAVTPGFIATEMLDHIPAKTLSSLTAQIPCGRLGRPEEVARIVHFLAADASSYITGQVWGVNGGLDM